MIKDPYVGACGVTQSKLVSVQKLNFPPSKVPATAANDVGMKI